MAITNISVSQDNIYSGSNLVPIHSPVVFVIDVTYTGLVPDTLNVDIVFDGTPLSTYECIPYKDVTTSLRQFRFIAGDAIRTLMNDFDDFNQLSDVLEFVENITKVFTLKFYDPDDVLTFDETIITFIHAANQFGESPNKLEIYNNDSDIYYSLKDGYVYVYFYNNDPLASLSIGIDTGGPAPSITASNPSPWPYFIGYSLPKSRATIDLLRTDSDPLRTNITDVTFTFHMPSGDSIVNKNTFLSIGDPLVTIDSDFIDTEVLTVGLYSVDFDGDFPQQSANIEALTEFVVYETETLADDITDSIIFTSTLTTKLNTNDQLLEGNNIIYTLEILGNQNVYNYNNLSSITGISRGVTIGIVKNIIGIDKYPNLTTLSISKGLESIPIDISNLLLLTNVSFTNGTLTVISELMDVLPLITLNLSSNSLVSLPETISNLVNLQTLTLSSNALLTSLAVSFGTLPALKTLTMIGCNAFASFPVNFTNLTTLEVLEMHSGTLDDVSLPDPIAGLTSLTELNIRNNGGLTVLPSDIGSLANLRIFDNTNCRTTIYPVSFNSLNLSTCKIRLQESSNIPDLSGMALLTTVTLNGLQGLFTSELQNINITTLQLDLSLVPVNPNTPTAVMASYTNKTSLTSLTFRSSACPTNLNLFTSLTYFAPAFGDFNCGVLPLSLTNIYAYATSNINYTNLYNATNLITLNLQQSDTSVPDGIDNLSLLETFNVRGTPFLTSVTLDLALCFNLKTIFLDGSGITQTNIENLLTAFSTNKASYINPVRVYLENQTPEIVYSPAMLAQIADLEDNYNFTFTI